MGQLVQVIKGEEEAIIGDAEAKREQAENSQEESIIGEVEGKIDNLISKIDDELRFIGAYTPDEDYLGDNSNKTMAKQGLKDVKNSQDISRCFRVRICCR